MNLSFFQLHSIIIRFGDLKLDPMPPRPQNMTGDFKTIILSGGSAQKVQKTTEI